MFMRAQKAEAESRLKDMMEVRRLPRPKPKPRTPHPFPLDFCLLVPNSTPITLTYHCRC